MTDTMEKMHAAAKVHAPLDFVARSKHFDSLLINAIEQLWQAGHQDGRQKISSLEKAERYVERAIAEEIQRLTFEEGEHRK